MAEPDDTLMMTILRELQSGVAELRQGQADLKQSLQDRFDYLSARIDRLSNRMDEGFVTVDMSIRRLTDLARAVDKDNEALRHELADLKARIVALEMRIGA